MRRTTVIGLAALLVAGCGGGGLRQTLEWKSGPDLTAHAASGVVENTTGHDVDLDPKAMRLLDADGRKVPGRFQVGESTLAAHASTPLRATWKSGKPVRIDYGTGALPLPSD